MEFLQLAEYRAAVFNKISKLNRETSPRILSNSGKYVKEDKGKFTQSRLTHRFYLTPS